MLTLVSQIRDYVWVSFINFTGRQDLNILILKVLELLSIAGRAHFLLFRWKSIQTLRADGMQAVREEICLLCNTVEGLGAHVADQCK